MKKVVLISANPTRFPYPVYPIGLGYLAQACQEAGHEAVQMDIQLEDIESIKLKIDQIEPDLIGLSVRNIDNTDKGHFSSYIEYYCRLVENLSSFFEKPVVLGGSGFSLYPEPIMRKTGADYGIVGEGEDQLVALLETLGTDRLPQNGRIFRQTQPLAFDKSRQPLRCPRIVAHYLQFGGIANVQSKRGCPYQCAYCIYPNLEGGVFRYRKVDDVIVECRELITRFGADYIYFTDSVLNDEDEFYLEVAEQLVRQEVKCRWTGFFKPKANWRREDVRLLKRSGLDCVEWGTDSSTDQTLSGMHKGFTWSAVQESNDVFAEEGIANGHYIIFGGPGETRETVKEGLENLKKLRDSVVFAFVGIRIIPNTQIYRTALGEGVIDSRWDGLDEKFYLSPGLKWEVVDGLVRESFDGDICRMYPPTENEELISTLHRRGLKGPLWDLMLKARRRRRSL